MFLVSFVSMDFVFFAVLLSPAISAKSPQSLGRMGLGGGGAGENGMGGGWGGGYYCRRSSPSSQHNILKAL